VIKEAAPKAEERMSYGMPSYHYKGRLIYFSAFKTHVGVYPSFQAEEHNLANYMAGKGTLRFPLNEPLPAALIRKLVKARVKEYEAKA
jgi:uncharacterized protein YdhG (YjbR/CyaY superfamily)